MKVEYPDGQDPERPSQRGVSAINLVLRVGTGAVGTGAVGTGPESVKVD